MNENYENGKCYVISMNKLAKFIGEMKIEKAYSFAAEWDEDEFVHKVEDCNAWYSFKKVNGFNDSYPIIIISRYDGGDEWCFRIDQTDFDNYSYIKDIVNDLKRYLRNFVDSTTIENYVCLDPCPLDEQ